MVGSWLATSVPGPLLSADDVAYAAMGRALAGDGAAALGSQPPYGVLYPVVLAPAWFFGLDEGGVLLWARVLNALFGAALIPILYLLVRRLAGASRPIAMIAAVVGASLPAHMATASVMWTERLLPLLVAGAVLALARLVERATTGRALVLGVLAVGLHATHPRTGVAALVFLAAAVWAVRRARGGALEVALVGVGGLVLATDLRSTLGRWAFSDESRYDLGDLASRRGFDELADMVMRAGGTVAYLVLATAGLSVVGAVMLWRDRSVGPWVLASLAGVVAVAGWFVVGVDGVSVARADAHLHGRYIEVFAPVLVAFGVVGVGRVNRWVAIGAVTAAPVAAGFFGAWAGPGDNWARPRSPVMMLGVEAGGAPFGSDIFEPGAAALVAVAVGGGFWLAARAPARRDLAIAAVGLAACGIGTASALESLDQLYEPAAAATVEAALGEVEDEIGEVAIEVGRVQANLNSAVVWEVGFDRTTAEVTPETTHLLLAEGAVGPEGSTVTAEFAGGTLWGLRSP